MKTSSLRKAFSIGLIVFFVVAIASIIVGFVSADSGCSFNETVCFQNETNKEQIGSYQAMDSNGRIVEIGFWKNGIDLFFNNPGCVYPKPQTTTTFYADWQKNWSWQPKTDLFGTTCYKLKKY